MDAALNLILALYRAAQETPIGEFQDLALNMLKALVPFRTANFCNGQFANRAFSLNNVHLHEEPPDVLEQFAQLNRAHPVAVSLTSRRPRVAFSIYAPALFASDEHSDMRDYLRRYGHERNLIIADLDTPTSPGNWLSLYRPEDAEEFDGRDERLLATVMPHFVEAVTINRSLGEARFHGAWRSSPAGCRALVRPNGVVIHCGANFAELIASNWPGWVRIRLPGALTKTIARLGHATLANGSVRIQATRIGECVLLTAIQQPLTQRLSPQQYVVAKLFGSGKSYKQIAAELQLSTSTVRNVVQNSYRKLGINDKTQLARLIHLDES